jgi:dipeptidyl-peptidase-4
VATDNPAGAVISALSRDQQRQLILDLPAGSSEPTTARVRTCTPWLTMHPGVPSRGPDGSLLEIIVNPAADCFQLVADDRPLSPETLNVTGVADVTADRLLVTVQASPMQQHVVSVDWEGRLTHLADGDTVSSVAASEGGMVIATIGATSTTTSYEARLSGATGAVASLAEQPSVDPVVTYHRVTERQLAVAVLWPTGHVPGSGRLPVVMTPYGGPHMARVVYSASAFAADQWLADQGFAVVVVDGAGTPGRGPAFEFEVRDDLATGVLDDQVAALQAVGALYPDLDLGRVGITGWSFGGYLAALAVLDRPDVFHAAVAGAPVTDWRLYDTAYTERYLGIPAENADRYDASSLLPRAAHLDRPLLIIHGLADDNVLVANTLQLSSALLAAGRPHSVLPLSGVTHMTPQEDVAENLRRLVARFLTEHLR